MAKTAMNHTIASVEDIIAITTSNYDILLHILETLDDQKINMQPFTNKRTIAEIIIHIIQAEQLPIFIHRFIDFLLSNSPNSSLGKPIDASDYVWDTSKGKNRKPKLLKQDKLIIMLKKIQKKKNLQYQHLNNHSRKFVQHYVRHVSIHRKQIEVLASKIQNA